MSVTLTFFQYTSLNPKGPVLGESLSLVFCLTVPLRKFAITITEDLLSAVDDAARSRSESRNRFVIRVLQDAVRARRDGEVTERLSSLFSDANFALEQARVAGEWDEVGTDWSSERW